jgi:hypothetical protein
LKSSSNIIIMLFRRFFERARPRSSGDTNKRENHLAPAEIFHQKYSNIFFIYLFRNMFMYNS